MSGILYCKGCQTKVEIKLSNRELNIFCNCSEEIIHANFKDTWSVYEEKKE